MGRVRNKTIKRSSRIIVEKYYPRLGQDFQVNKRIVDEVAQTPSKRMRNRIAGYTTHLMGRIKKGPVRNISIKLQEEERERRENYVPTVSAIPTEFDIDNETKLMLREMEMANLPGIRVVPVGGVSFGGGGGGGGAHHGGGAPRRNIGNKSGGGGKSQKPKSAAPQPTQTPTPTPTPTPLP